MITYKLNEAGTYANKVVDDVPTQEWQCVQTNPEYLAWLAEGNEPEPADEVQQ